MTNVKAGGLVKASVIHGLSGLYFWLNRLGNERPYEGDVDKLMQSR